jgi:hypothetical protein
MKEFLTYICCTCGLEIERVDMRHHPWRSERLTTEPVMCVDSGTMECEKHRYEADCYALRLADGRPRLYRNRMGDR